jgi:hypothetical protein
VPRNHHAQSLVQVVLLGAPDRLGSSFGQRRGAGLGAGVVALGEQGGRKAMGVWN